MRKSVCMQLQKFQKTTTTAVALVSDSKYKYGYCTFGENAYKEVVNLPVGTILRGEVQVLVICGILLLVFFVIFVVLPYSCSFNFFFN